MVKFREIWVEDFGDGVLGSGREIFCGGEFGLGIWGERGRD